MRTGFEKRSVPILNRSHSLMLVSIISGSRLVNIGGLPELKICGANMSCRYEKIEG
jgi:hypothetical protein